MSQLRLNTAVTPPMQSPTKVLLIGASKSEVKVYTSYLQAILQSDFHRQYEILVPPSREQGVEWWRSHRPDVVLLDLIDRTGIHVLESLHEGIKRQLPLPVIVLIQAHQESLAEQALKLGAMDYLVKEHLTGLALRKTVAAVLLHRSLVKQAIEQKVEPEPKPDPELSQPPIAQYAQQAQSLIASCSASSELCAGSHSHLSLDLRDQQHLNAILKQQLAAIECAKDGIAILKEDTYVYLNQSHLEMFGYDSPEQLLGKSWRSLYSEAELDRFKRDIFPILIRDRAWQGEAIAKRSDGSSFDEGLSLTVTDDGLLICVCRDISAQKQAERACHASQQLLQGILDTVPIAVFWKDQRLKYQGINNYSATIIGLNSAEELIGVGDDQLPWNPETLAQIQEEDRQVLRSGEAVLRCELEYGLVDGSTIWLETNKIPLKDAHGRTFGILGTAQEITKRKQAEATLKKQAESEHLALMIAERIRQSLDLQTIFDVACNEIRAVLKADRVGIFRFYPPSDYDDGCFVAESVIPPYSSALSLRVHDHCFGDNYSQLYANGRYFVVDDIYNNGLTKCHSDILAQFEVRANLVMPLLCGSELWGLLCIHQCDRPRHWLPDEVELAHRLANQLAIAIQQSSLYYQVQQELEVRQQAELRISRQLQEQTVLAQITERIRQSLDLHQILNTVTQQVQAVMQCDRVIVFQLFDDGRSAIVEEAVLEGLVHLKDRHWEDEVWSSEILEWYWQGKARIVADVMDDRWTDCLREYSQEGQIQSKIVAPILQEAFAHEDHRWVAPAAPNKLWGVLVVHACHEKRVWQESEAQLLQQIANQLAIAIQQATLVDRLKQELTQRQAAQAQLTERNQQLALNNEELARATRLKDEFLANMSHELRTPLNAILGIVEGLQENVFGPVSEQQIKVLQIIERSGNHLLSLINDILDLAKIEAGRVELAYNDVEVRPLCDSSLAFVKQQALEKRIRLSTKLPRDFPPIRIDERRVRQVLINLLNNAVKFTSEGGSILLEVGYANLDGSIDQPDPNSPNLYEALRFSVTDTGIGISEENLKRLFQPFIQVDSALNRQYEGTGLGLALVKRIVNLHGGMVNVTSTLGQGSCFSFTLPLTQAVSAAAVSGQGAEVTETTSLLDGPESAPLILLVEDNEANIVTVSSYLDTKGYRLLVARDGAAAVTLATLERPDLILMDIQMPGVDGIEAMRQIRNDEELADVPIIALTALTMPGDRERCLQAGANDYLSKPMRLKQLMELIQKWLLNR